MNFMALVFIWGLFMESPMWWVIGFLLRSFMGWSWGQSTSVITVVKCLDGLKKLLTHSYFIFMLPMFQISHFKLFLLKVITANQLNSWILATTQVTD